MIESFVFQALPGRVVFGPGALGKVAGEVRGLGGHRVFLISSGSATTAGDQVAADLGDLVAARWLEVVQHVPVALADRARRAADAARADTIVSVGGGSAVGLAKAVALSHRLPVVAVPTTYSGSEMTPIYGLTGDGTKHTGRDLAVLPKVVVYDPLLTLVLPGQVTGPSAFNAMAHCVEALYAPGHNPITSALALHGIEVLARALPVVLADPADVAGRSDLLLGACLAGSVLAVTGTGLHHKICHALGGGFNLVHADTHSVVLPHVVAFNAPGLADQMAGLAQALGTGGRDPASFLWDLASASGVPTSLQALGLPACGIATVADRVAGQGLDNPVPVTAAAIRDLLERAYLGHRPTSLAPA